MLHITCRCGLAPSYRDEPQRISARHCTLTPRAHSAAEACLVHGPAPMGSELACHSAYLRREVNVKIKKTRAGCRRPSPVPGGARRRFHDHYHGGPAIVRECLTLTALPGARSAVHHAISPSGPGPSVESNRPLCLNHPYSRAARSRAMARLVPTAPSLEMSSDRDRQAQQRTNARGVEHSPTPSADDASWENMRSARPADASLARQNGHRFRASKYVETRFHTMNRSRMRIPFHFSNNALCFFPKKRVMIAA